MEIATLVLSCISIIVAIVSFVRSTKSQVLQDKINSIEYKLKIYELSEKENAQKMFPCVEARIIHIIDQKYLIRVWNSGNTTAKNINVKWDNTEIVFYDESKLPFEFLSPQKSFDLSISIFFGSPQKMFITTVWEDDTGKQYSKEQLCSF